ncbi:PEP-CTERM sorting domain-containing protein [Thalassotalea euphylliae]|uniref:PEP-CTERM sorting domain-containing protein n=1 Tax=Thalassotalea euphylliae TaxID=1655234 RepID=UPI003643EC30
MKKTLFAFAIFVVTAFIQSAHATMIQIDYEIDFTGHEDNSHITWVNGAPAGYDDQALIDYYLDGTFTLSVLYNTERSGLMAFSNGTRRDTANWAEILYTDIDLSQSNGGTNYNVFGNVTSNKGQTIRLWTALSNQFDFTFDVINIEDLQVGDVSVYGSLDNIVGEFLRSYGGNSNSAVDYSEASSRYALTATITNITQVPEPSTLAILALGFIGLARRKAK